MKIENNLNIAQSILNDFIQLDEQSSVGYIAIFDIITPADIITIKNAKKLLDIIVVQNVSNKPFTAFSINTLEKLDINIGIDYIDESNNDMIINFKDDSINSQNLLSGILAVLPSSIFVSSDNFAIFKVITNISNKFIDLFSLHNVTTPSNIKSHYELEIIELLQKLEKSNLEPIEENIRQQLANFSVMNFQKYDSINGFYVNLLIAHSPSNISITYHFKQK